MIAAFQASAADRGAAGWARLRARAQGLPAGVRLVLAGAMYLGFACYFTWPLAKGITHTIYGAPGDPYGTMAFYREIVDHGKNPFLSGTLNQFSAPAGQAIPWPRNLAALPGVLTFYLLTVAFGSVTADGLYILLGFTATGVVTYMFVRRLTGDGWAALIAGWAFAFYPFAVLNGQGHVDEIHGWVLVLGVWRMLELIWRPTLRNGLLAGLAVVFGMWWSPYFILFGGAAFATALVVGIVIAWRRNALRAAVAPYAVATAIVLVLAAFLGVLSTKGSGAGIGTRSNSAQELIVYAARPAEYVVPDDHSPLFGSKTQHYLETHLHGSNASEATLYVGVTVVLLALLACFALVRRRLPPRLGQAAIVLAAIALVALVTSAPPEVRVFGTLVPFPSHFISQVTSTWRVYSRFVILVMLALSALAAIGLTYLTGRSPRWRVAIMLAASIIVPLDLWARLGGRTNELNTPPIYYTLARQPQGLVAEYPLTPYGFNNYGDLFFQSTHKKPMLNGYLEGTPEERRALTLTNLADPNTVAGLATLGVRYVLLDAAPTLYGLPSAGTPGRGLKLISSEPYASLYRVTAHPIHPAIPAAGEGFADSEPAPLGVLNWLEQDSGKIEVAGSCTPCKGVLRMTVAAFDKPRTVTVTDQQGHVLVRRLIGAPTRLELPLQFSRLTNVTLAATPGPQSIKAAIGGTDTRSVSVQVTGMEFVGRGAGGAAGTRGTA